LPDRQKSKFSEHVLFPWSGKLLRDRIAVGLNAVDAAARIFALAGEQSARSKSYGDNAATFMG
jgi:hypothetical protein